MCGLPSRLETKLLPRALLALDAQAAGREVEVLCLLDNRKRSIGSKRNALLDLAQGEYIAYVDDDDRVAPDYVEAILGALVDRPDVVVFDVWVTGYKQSHRLDDRICRYDIGFQNENLATEYRRRPNHLMVWRTELARASRFVDTSHGEDTAWADALLSQHSALRQARIEKTLYFYEFDPEHSRK